MMLDGYIVRFLSQTIEEITIRIRIRDKYDIDISPFNGSAYKKPPTGRIYYYIKSECFNIFIRDEPNFNKIYNIRVNNIIDSSKLLGLLRIISSKGYWTMCNSSVNRYRLNEVIKILESYD